MKDVKQFLVSYNILECLKMLIFLIKVTKKKKKGGGGLQVVRQVSSHL